jgi:hypothetical protein
MNLSGVVMNGVVVLDGNTNLAEGTRVRILVSQEPPEASSNEPLALQSLLALAGTVNGLPPDMAEQHDHYVHGTPKK